ncbi:hypothetical protein A9Q74_01315 [Colwellia sp. 39_35_sub15_T18]|nr:hypothetical protein A9Q74_01315 [Colwellia sp. 39_35_sub15_T18]
MNFQYVLEQVELLIGKKLESITTSTNSIEIVRIDHKLNKYFVKVEGNDKQITRTFRELEDIWNDLVRQGFVNVDQALYGGGSSRNQPETILANLTCINHFKFKSRKHLLLRNSNVHELGTLQELTSTEVRLAKRKIENYLSFSNLNLHNQQADVSNNLKIAFDSIIKKFPGDTDVERAEKAFKQLSTIQESVINSIVSIDNISELNTQISTSNKEPFSELHLDQLLDDESFTGIANEAEDEIIEEEEEIASSEKKGKPRIRQLTPTISLIFDRLEHDEIELQPDFQRQDRIWKNPKKSKLIESILMGLPLPVFYFGEKSNGDWVVVDGLQRITSVYDFMRGEFKLEKLESLDKYNTLSFKDLDRTSQRRIREYSITSYLIDIESDGENMIVELFHRINTYGVKLSDQEIRSALNQGKSVKFLRFLAGLSDFKQATYNKIKADRQRDMELCLGAISFILLGYKEFKYNLYNDFLTDAMRELNKKEYNLTISDLSQIDNGTTELSPTSSDIFKQLHRKFTFGLNVAHDVFGAYAFKKEDSYDKKVPISKPLFELIVACFSFLSHEQYLILKENSDDFLESFYNAIRSESKEYATWNSDRYEDGIRGFKYSISTSTGKRATVLYRFDSMIGILKNSLNIELKFNPLVTKTND